MSSSRSNMSNDSSHSNILTLSQDSSSSQLKPHTVNIYYKKFISKLGFLFRIDTNDLDALYNKIAQCVDENDGFSQSDDADIAQLIQLARKLQDNHNLLKNMVEVLDQRFLKNISTPQKKSSSSQKKDFELSLTPNSKKDSNQKQQSTPIVNIFKKHTYGNNQNKQSQAKLNNQNDYGSYFTDTLKKARQSVQKKKQLLRLEKQKYQKTVQPLKPEQQIEKKAANLQQSSQSIKKSMYEGRVNRIFQQMNKIKAQLYKIQNNQNSNANGSSEQQISVNFDTPFFENHKTTKSQLIQKVNQEQDDKHQVFKQINQDQYYLYDYRFSNLQPVSPNPKLSLKNLYTKMGINPNENVQSYNYQIGNNQMGIIKQMPKQSQSMVDIKLQNQQYKNQQHFNHVHHAGYDVKGIQQYSNQNQQNRNYQHSLLKSKSGNASTEVGNLTLQYSGYVFQKPNDLNKKNNEQDLVYDQNFPQQESEKSYNVSNATIIDKLSTVSNVQLNKNIQRKNQRKNTNTSIIQLQYQNMQNDLANKRQTLGSIQTTLPNNSIKSAYINSTLIQQNKMSSFDPVSPLQYQKSNFCTKIVQRNDKSRQKINDYLNRLDQRNKVLKQYVQNIERSLSKQKQKSQINNSSVKPLIENDLQVLTNAVYTDNQLIVPKFVPSNPSATSVSQISPKAQILQLKKSEGETNFSFSDVNPIQTNNKIVFSPKFNTYSQKQFDESNKDIDDSIYQKGSKPIVPMIENLIQNQQIHIEEGNIIDFQEKQTGKQQQNKQAKIQLKNNLYFQNQAIINNDLKIRQADGKASNYQVQKNTRKITIKQPQSNKIKNEISSFNKKQSFEKQKTQIPQLQLLSTPSLNSIQGRIQQHKDQYFQNINQQSSNQFFIPRVSANSLFEQTRNVQSKIQLSQERSYKCKVPGQQIEKIKDRVNQMFKKIKSIRQHPANPQTKIDIASSKSIQHQQINLSNKSQNKNTKYRQQQTVNEHNKNKNNQFFDSKPRFYFKVPEQPNIIPQFRSTGTFFKPSQVTQPEPLIRNISILSNSSKPADNSIVQNNYSGSPTQLNFMYQSSNNRNSRQSQPNRCFYKNQQSNNQKYVQISNSRESNFSFKGSCQNNFEQDSIRSSMQNSGLQQASRVDSNRSRRQKKIIVQNIPRLGQNSIINGLLSVNRSPQTNSHRSISNQSKQNYLKTVSSLTNSSHLIRDNPALPPRPQQLRQSQHKIHIQNTNKIVQIPIRTNEKKSFAPPVHQAYKSPPIPVRKTTPQRKQVSYQYPIKTNTSPITPKYQTTNSFFPIQNKNLTRNYSQAVLAQSIVSSYSNIVPSQKQFIPPHIVSVPIITRPIQPQNLSVTSFNTSIVLPQKYNRLQRDSSRSNKSRSNKSGSKGKKGINVVSKKQIYP